MTYLRTSSLTDIIYVSASKIQILMQITVLDETITLSGGGVTMQDTNRLLLGNQLQKTRKENNKLWKRVIQSWELYIFIAPAFFYFLIFSYGPMYGIQIAFKNFIPTKGILGSDWVGFDHFNRFFNSYYFWDLLWNTFSISLYDLAIGFPIPIILALAFNEIKDGFFKRLTQTVTYAGPQPDGRLSQTAIDRIKGMGHLARTLVSTFQVSEC
jgi:ABC-type phosphate/phosphonate transport system permease subunit